MNSSGECAKYLMLLFNIVFFISGIVVLAIGSCIKAREKDYYSLIGTDLFTVCNLLISIGVLVTVFGILGCYSSLQENRFLLYVYAWLLCLIFAMEYAAGITAFVFRGELTETISTNLYASLYELQDTNSTSITSQWNYMQQDLQCCGVIDFSDWKIVFNETDSNLVPGSCCKISTRYCDINSPAPIEYDSTTMYITGCMEAAINKYDYYAVIIGGTPIGMSFLQVLGIVFACCMAIAIKD